MNSTPKEKFNAQYALLRRLQFETLPLSFSDAADIGDLQILHSARLLECTFPACGGYAANSTTKDPPSYTA